MYTRVYVEITNVCNMSCSFCHGHSRAPRNMTEEEFTHILSELDGQTKHIYYHLMGEPLLHKDLGKFLNIAKEKGFRSLITTNGTLLKEKGDELLENGVYKLNISLHSFEEQGEEYLKRYLENVVEFVEKAKNYKTIVILRLWNKSVKDTHNQQIISFLRSHIDGEWTENELGYKIRNRLHISVSERFDWPDIDGKDLGEDTSCLGMRDHFGILADGTVVPCCLDSQGIINLGNVFEESVEDILSSPRATAIKYNFGKRKAVEELCRKCPYSRKF